MQRQRRFIRRVTKDLGTASRALSRVSKAIETESPTHNLHQWLNEEMRHVTQIHNVLTSGLRPKRREKSHDPRTFDCRKAGSHP